MGFKAARGKAICLEGGEHRFRITVGRVSVYHEYSCQSAQRVATQSLGEAFLLRGGILVASTAASHWTDEALQILLERVIAKLHVFMYVCLGLFFFHCGKSK